MRYFDHNDVALIYRTMLRGFFKDTTDNFENTPDEELQKIYPYAAGQPKKKYRIESDMNEEIKRLTLKYRGNI